MLTSALLSFVLATTPAAIEPWALMAERDIRAMHDQIRDNHPGPVDPLNPKFSEWLEQGLTQSLERARAARRFSEYQNALRFYAAGFRDGHLNVSFSVAPTQVSWPRFILGRRGDAIVVTRVAEGQNDVPPAGSVLVDCEGATPRQIFERDLIPLHAGPVIESAYDTLASLLLLRGAGAKQCRFTNNGETKTYDLRYRSIAFDTLTKMREPEPIARSVRRTANGGVWVSIPSFQGADPETGEWLRKLVADAPSWRDAQYVVFDVRGNGGGNSSWGDRIVDALYGGEFLSAVTAGEPGSHYAYAEWRVSKDNLAHVRDSVASVTAQLGPDASHTRSLKETEQEMVAALEKGKSLIDLGGAEARRPARTESMPSSAFNGRVVLLTDGYCASACLDFADTLYSLPKFMHAGRMTSADSVYMETRGTALPSTIATLNLPIKVYRHRARGHNEPYVPRWKFDGDVSDTAAVEQWLLAKLRE